MLSRVETRERELAGGAEGDQLALLRRLRTMLKTAPIAIPVAPESMTVVRIITVST